MWKYRGQKRPHFAEPTGPGQESVWDYPRPPEIQQDKRLVEVEFKGQMIGSTSQACRILETASPPTFYIPPKEICWPMLRSFPLHSVCEWKGTAQYWQLAEEPGLGAVGWSYADPRPPFNIIRDYISFFPALVECFVAKERVRPQPGSFYGGWVTDGVKGPFKGEPGTDFW